MFTLWEVGNIMKNEVKYYESLFLGVGYTLMVVLGYGFTIVIVMTPNIFENTQIYSLIGIYTLFVAGPTIMWICLIHRGFSRITINQKGLSKSLFKIFYKKRLKWSEITDIRVMSLVENRIYFSRINLDSVSHRKLVNHKDVIHLPLSKDVCSKISRYSNRKFELIEEVISDKL